MQKNVESFGARLKEAPVETPGAIGAVGRYHIPLRLAYQRVGANGNLQISDKEC